jgi:hypothetical protein
LSGPGRSAEPRVTREGGHAEIPSDGYCGVGQGVVRLGQLYGLFCQYTFRLRGRIYLLCERSLRRLECSAFVPRRDVSDSGCSPRPHQAAIEGRSRPALRLGPAAARPYAGRPRNSRVPHAGPSKRRARAPQSGPSSKSARRAGSLRQSPRHPPLLYGWTSRTAPGANQGIEVGQPCPRGTPRAHRRRRCPTCRTPGRGLLARLSPRP